MNRQQTIYISACCFVAGAFILLFLDGWIIVRKNTPLLTVAKREPAIIRKQCVLNYFAHQRWQQETVELLWPPTISAQLEQIIKQWLLMMFQEKQSKHISLISVMLDAHNTHAYISLNRIPFGKQDSIHKKLMWYESLLKTIAENVLQIRTIQLLVNHELFHDRHLDCTRPWPVAAIMV